jgi:imidazole glycerol-phosphate synthase subunit HisF
MKRVRVIPVLLLAGQGLVKTRRFSQPRYLGDPINAVKIFNDKMVDELILLDIEATAKGRIDFDWIEDIVSEAFMPVAYGGGIGSVDQCGELLKRGVEKIVLNTAAYAHPQLVSEAAQRFGSQSVVVSIDARQNLLNRTRAYVKRGRKSTGLDPVELARRCERLGAGEIMLTSIDREGTFGGYDLELLQSVCDAVTIPVIAHGGAGSIADFKRAIAEGRCSAVAAGSMFVFAAESEGMLISYPSQADLREQLWQRLD